MPFDLDVIIDIGSNGFPMSDHVALGRQRFQRRAVQLLEQKGAADIRTLAEATAV